MKNKELTLLVEKKDEEIASLKQKLKKFEEEDGAEHSEN